MVRTDNKKPIFIELTLHDLHFCAKIASVIESNPASIEKWATPTFLFVTRKIFSMINHQGFQFWGAG